MDKIYSRSNSVLKFFNNMKLVKKIIILSMVAVLIAYYTANRLIDTINPTLEREAKAMAKRTTEKICNEASKEILKNISYSDLCTISQDKDGNVTMINMNTININKVSSEIALKIQEGMNKSENNIIGISLGSLTRIKLLSGRGPKINVILQMIGYVHTSVKSEIKEAGINQSVHKIYLNLESEVSIASPYKDTDDKICNEILLAESIIIGKIPDTYNNEKE